MSVTDLADFCQSHQVLHCVSLTPGEADHFPCLVFVLASRLAHLQWLFGHPWPRANIAVIPLRPSPPCRTPSVLTEQNPSLGKHVCMTSAGAQ